MVLHESQTVAQFFDVAYHNYMGIPKYFHMDHVHGVVCCAGKLGAKNK